MSTISTTIDDDIEVYESDIHMYLDEYIKAQTEEDENFNMFKAPQSRWNAALIYIYKHLFKSTDKLYNSKSDKMILSSSKSPEHIVYTNHNSYNLNIVNAITDIYIELCMQFNKECSIMGLSYLTGISNQTITDWGSNCQTTSCQSSELSVQIYKKIVDNREESLSDKLVSSGQALGVLGVLNRHYGWNMGQPKETVHRIEIQDTNQIAAKYGLSELSDNSKQLGKDE